MHLSNNLGLLSIFKRFRAKIIITWGMVLIENLLLSLLPLFIGYAIDDLLDGGNQKLFVVAGLLILLTLISVIRRAYDTRAYGAIRVAFGVEVDKRHAQQSLSTRNARLDMGRELVDFMEEDVPALLTAVIQIIVTLVVLSLFDFSLTFTAFVMTLAMVALYSQFHNQFYQLNGKLNSQMETQIINLKAGRSSLLKHLGSLRDSEVKLSDTEAIVYGAIFLLVTGFIISNLWLSTRYLTLSAGSIFSVVSYSWDYVEAAILLPVTLQSWSRLHEITHRLNKLKPPEIPADESSISYRTAP